jgi:hypothetical protein
MPQLGQIVNLNEEKTFRELEDLGSQFGYRVYPKMRVADVLPIDKQPLPRDLYSFALMAHFDFVATDADHHPLFAVEFDGPSHISERQQGRDSKKDRLCESFEFPLLRINSRHLTKRYNKMSLLRWIVSAWELQQGFSEAQSRGTIPIDEPFDPIFLFHSGKTLEERYPHWISLSGRLHIQKLHKQGRLPYRGSCGIYFTDPIDNYHGIEWIDVAERRLVFVKIGMKKQNFPLYLGDLFDELMSVLLYEKLIDYLRTGTGWVSPEAIEDLINSYVHRYQWAGSHGGGTSVSYSGKLGLGGRWLTHAGTQEAPPS